MPKHLCQRTMAVLAVSGFMLLGGCGNETSTSNNNETVVAQPEPPANPALSKSIVKPEHQNKPTYTNEETNQYMVLLEPITDSGDLNLTMITLETNEVTPVVINCTDLKQNDDRALLQVGRPDGLEETVGDYIDWYSAAFHHFCGEWNGSPASPQSTAPSPRTAPQTKSLPATPAALTSETPDAKINVRNGPSIAARASAYGYAGDRVVLLAEAKDEQDFTWYQVRFDESKHVGWVREDFVSTELGRSPSPTVRSGITPLPETAATLTSDTPGSRINVRTGPSTSTSSPAYGFAGDRVVLLAETKDNQNNTWYQVRFQESRHVGWVRQDFVATNSASSTPQPVVSRAPIREPVSGSCDCPYDITSNGSACGGRSAYSQPGGAEPICYTTDR